MSRAKASGNSSGCCGACAAPCRSAPTGASPSSTPCGGGEKEAHANQLQHVEWITHTLRAKDLSSPFRGGRGAATCPGSSSTRRGRAERPRSETAWVGLLGCHPCTRAGRAPVASKDAETVRRRINGYDLARVVDTIVPFGSIMVGDWQVNAPWRRKREAKAVAGAPGCPEGLLSRSSRR